MKNSYEETSRRSLNIEKEIKYPGGRQARKFFLNEFTKVLHGVTDGYVLLKSQDLSMNGWRLGLVRVLKKGMKYIFIPETIISDT